MGVAGPVLLGLPSGEADRPSVPLDQATEAGSWEKLPRHRDEDQVQLDVNRAFIYYPKSMIMRLSLSFSLGPLISLTSTLANLDQDLQFISVS